LLKYFASRDVMLTS